MHKAVVPEPSRAQSPAFDAETFGRVVRERLLSLGWSYRVGEAEIGVDHSTLNRVARGHAPDVENYLRLSNWLAEDGIANTWVIYRDDGSGNPNA